MAGLTAAGFVPATVEEIRVAISNAIKARFGQNIDTTPSSRVGQFIDVIAFELESLWLGLQAVYDSQYPLTAYGTSLDNIGSITNTVRNPGYRGSVNVYFGGVIGKAIPASTSIATQAGFELATLEARTILANRSLLYIDEIPDGGFLNVQLITNGVYGRTFGISPGSTELEIKQSIFDFSHEPYKVNAIETDFVSIPPVIKITTNVNTGFGVGNILRLVVVNTTENTATWFNAVDLTVTAISGTLITCNWNGSTGGGAPPRFPDFDSLKTCLYKNVGSQRTFTDLNDIEVIGVAASTGGIWIKTISTKVPANEYSFETRTDISFDSKFKLGTSDIDSTWYNSIDPYVVSEGREVGASSFPPHTVTDLLSVIQDVPVVINLSPGTAATARETDAEYRLRLMGDLTKSGASTITGIVEELKKLEGVTYVGIIENPTGGAVSGRPAHSYEVYVEGGLNNEIAQKIYDLHPPGIQIVSTATGPAIRTGSYIDVNGQPATLQFSSVTGLALYVEIKIKKSAAYPVNGDSLIKTQVQNTINALGIGEVFYTHTLYGPVNTVPGITSLTILSKKFSTAGAPQENAVITPTATERCTIDPANIIITVVP